MWEGALKGYHKDQAIPVLNAEANYEDIFAQFWNFPNDTTGAVRVTAVDVRQSAWWGLLSGSSVGFAYGANGVWQWTYEIGGGFRVRRGVMDALRFPGAAQLARMRTLAEANEWHLWEPRPDLAEELDSPDFIAAALAPGRLVAYLPVNTTRFRLTVPEDFGPTLRLTWSSATSETTIVTDEMRGAGTVDLTAPGPDDWFLVVRPAQDTASVPPTAAAAVLRHAGANPSRRGAALVATLSEPRRGRLDVFDALGRRVHAEAVALQAGETVIELPMLASGTYVCQLAIASAGETSTVATLRVTVLR